MKLVDERVLALFKRHWRQTLTYWSVFFSFGLSIAFLGPTILDLRCQTRSSLEQITWVFFCQQLFLLLGSAVGGIFKKTLLSSLSALFTCTFVISLVLAIIPLCYDVGLLSVAMAIIGLAMGIIDTIANLQLVKLYQKDSAIFLQALHFFTGLGALVSPLVADPFLSDENCIILANWTGNSSADLENIRNHLAGHGAGLHDPLQYPLHIHGIVITNVAYAFWIMALINLPVPTGVLALMYHERLQPCCRSSPPLLDEDCQDGTDGSGHGSVFDCCNPAKLQGQPATFFLVHALGGAIVFLADGIIGSYAGFVYSYAVSPPVLMSHRSAAYLNSLFWASITLGRLVLVCLSCRYAPQGQLTVSLIGVILVQCLLMIFYTSYVFVFIGTCVLGLCISSVFPSMVAYTEDILDYKGCATTVLVTSASTGEMILQLMVGSIMHAQGSYNFLLCCTITPIIAFILFLLLLYVQHIHRKRNTGSSERINMQEKPSTSDSWSDPPLGAHGSTEDSGAEGRTRDKLSNVAPPPAKGYNSTS